MEKNEAITKPKKKKRDAKSYAIEFFAKVGMTAAVLWLLLTYVAGVYVNHSNSSYPMIKDGDLCLTYKLESPAQGEVVAYETEDGIRFGRVIALSGDSVEIKDDHIAVNGLGVFDETVYATSAEGSAISYPYKVPEGCVFVLNDHRNDISDSRKSGGIKLDDCRGKVVFVMRRRGI
ncbi:MAG: signal peptidase I [Ruminococcus sp.]|nr:signal peptidase I [Ruminococcus sp.]